MTTIVSHSRDLLLELRATAHAHSDDGVRPALRFRWFIHDEDGWAIWASDNYRMVRYRMSTQEGTEGTDTFGIDHSGTKRIASMLAFLPKWARRYAVSLIVKDGAWRLETADGFVGGRVADDMVQFPDFKGLMDRFDPLVEPVAVHPGFLAQAGAAAAMTENAVYLRRGESPYDPYWLTGGPLTEAIMPVKTVDQAREAARLKGMR